MSKYDKSIQVSREEEGVYHKREYQHQPASQPVTTTTYTTVVSPASKSHKHGKSKSLATKQHLDGHESSCSDSDNYEQWTTSKRKVNHKTRQIETRVSRQLLVEDGKVIADSGPQVTTRIKEDNRVEECKKEKAPKDKARFDALRNAPEGTVDPHSGRVLGEKKQIQKVSHEVREENMQYRDERMKELTGHDVHRKAARNPNELITISADSPYSAPKGKMVNYSNKAKKYEDTDEILEVAKLAIDGSITKEVKRTRHHEEFSDDEKPDETGEAEALREAPTVTRSNRRHFDYVNDFDDTSTPPPSDHEGSRRRHHGSSGKEASAFPKYTIEPRRNQDLGYSNNFNQNKYSNGHSATPTRHANKSAVEHIPVVRRNSVTSTSSSSDNDNHNRHHHHHSANRNHHHHHSSSGRHSSHSGGFATPTQSQSPVEIPEEYRVNRQRLLSSKYGTPAMDTPGTQRELSVSPPARRRHRDRKQSTSSSASSDLHDKQQQHHSTTTHSKQQHHYQPATRAKSPAHNSRSMSPDSMRGPKVTTKTKTTTLYANQDLVHNDQPHSKSHHNKDKDHSNSKRNFGSKSSRSSTVSGRNSTTIRVPYKNNHHSGSSRMRDDDAMSMVSVGTITTINNMNEHDDYEHVHASKRPTPVKLDKIEPKVQLGGNIASLKRRLSLISDQQQQQHLPVATKHFNYKTVVANLKPVSPAPKQHVVEAYSVRVIHHSSPFTAINGLPVNSVSQLSKSVAELEMSSNPFATKKKVESISKTSDLGSSLCSNVQTLTKPNGKTTTNVQVNMVTNTSNNINNNNEGEVVSVKSFASSEATSNLKPSIIGSEQDGNSKAAAWIYDLRNGASIPIEPTPKPEAPKLETKTDELVQSKGGRAYYLELVEPHTQSAADTSMSSMSRWNSMSTIGNHSASYNHNANHNDNDTSRTLRKPSKAFKSSHQLSSGATTTPSMLSTASKASSIKSKSSVRLNQLHLDHNRDHDLHLDHDRRLQKSLSSFLINRSKSSSSLAVNSTRLTKYSMFGGLREDYKDGKPVPRLSYSRAIGPRSQRQIETRAKLQPSRYLKIK